MRRHVRILFIALAAAFVGASATAGADSLTIGLNESRRIPLPGAAATVVVGDPKVADVAMTDSHSVILMGRGYGRTQLIVTDQNGRTLLASEITVPEHGHVTLFRGLQANEYGCGEAACELQSDPKGDRGGSTGPAVASGDQGDMAAMHRSAMSGAGPLPTPTPAF
jgi:hypothetical protein